MAVAVIGELPDGNAQLDQQLMTQLGVSPQTPPQGALARMAGPRGDSYRVISIWESEDAWETFKREKLTPVLQQAGRGMPPFEVWPLDTFFTAPR